MAKDKVNNTTSKLLGNFKASTVKSSSNDLAPKSTGLTNGKFTAEVSQLLKLVGVFYSRVKKAKTEHAEPPKSVRSPGSSKS